MDFSDVIPYAARAFFDSMNHGELKTPTEFVFTLTVHCWRVYEEMLAKSDLMSEFLTTETTAFSSRKSRTEHHVIIPS